MERYSLVLLLGNDAKCVLYCRFPWSVSASVRRDKKTWEKINKLIDATCRTPFDGIGHPEALKRELQGYWSRRIAEDHRLVYSVEDDQITIISCRYHYDGINLPDR